MEVLTVNKLEKAAAFGAMMGKEASNAARRVFTKLMQDMSAGKLRWHGTSDAKATDILSSQVFKPSTRYGDKGDMTFSRHLPMPSFTSKPGQSALGFSSSNPAYIARGPSDPQQAGRRLNPLESKAPIGTGHDFRMNDGPTKPIDVIPQSGLLRWAKETDDPNLNAQFKKFGARIIPKDLFSHLTKNVTGTPLSQRALDLHGVRSSWAVESLKDRVIDRAASTRHLSTYNPNSSFVAPAADSSPSWLQRITPDLSSWWQKITQAFQR